MQSINDLKRLYITNENREGQRIWFNKVDDRTYTIHSDSKYALKYASNPQFKSSYAFYKDVK